MILSCAIALVALAVAAPPARSCITAGPVTLKELAHDADLAIKATAIADHPVNDPSFEKVSGFEVRETEMRVISVVKGTASNVIEFRHYAPTLGMRAPLICLPRSYKLVLGRTYIVLATRIGESTYEQLSKSPGGLNGERTVFPAANARPLPAGTTLTKAVWRELTARLRSRSSAVVLKTVDMLDEMSIGRGISPKDFRRSEVLAAIQPLIGAKNVAIASAAIRLFAMDSPYTDDWSTPQRLAGLGKGTFPGVAPMKTPGRPLTHSAEKLLLRVATSGAPAQVRARAITALARSHSIPRTTIAEWFRDPSLVVRKAAVLASAASPDRMTIKAASTDRSPEIRQAAALAMGLTQDPHFLPLLGKLLKDPAATVRAAAAMSLISFGPARAAQVMRANFGSQFGPLFVNALARGNPQPYLPLLARIIRRQPQPADWWGGWTPAVDSWDILFDYIMTRPAAELASGKLNRWLDTLQRAPAQPTDLYALYLSRGLTTRAKQFRATMRHTPGYINNVYNSIERDPKVYVQ